MEEWEAQAACRQYDPDTMFPARDRDQREVAQICHLLCPVQAECLEAALRRGEHHGVWGGLTERERRKLKGTA